MAYLSEWGIPIFRIDPGPTGLDAFGDFVTGLPIDIFAVASGGASAGGAATATAIAGASASGGMAAGGAATLSGAGDLAATGGGQAGGSATMSGGFMAGDISASGGAAAGGSAYATTTTPPDTTPPDPVDAEIIVSDYVMDLLAMYADFGQSVRLRPVAGPVVDGSAFLDAPGASLLSGEILGTDYSMRFPVQTFPAVRKGDQIISGGVTYTARQSSQPISIDGLEHVVPLSR